MTTIATTFGLRAESWIVELLVANGYQAIHATAVDDKVHKVDFWVVWHNRWLAIQFSIDRQKVVGRKGLDALARGVVPSWLDGQELERAVSGQLESRQRVLSQFWKQVEAIVASHPELPVRRPEATALQHSTGGTKVLAGVK